VFGLGALGARGAAPVLGFVGSPIASGATQAAVLALLVLTIRGSPPLHERHWPGWRWREATAWPRVRVFLAQAAPSFVTFFVQETYLQVISLLAAGLGPAQIAAHTALLQLLCALTCLVFGLTKAAQVRVGLLRGRGDARRARSLAALATAACTAASTAVGLTLVAVRGVSGRAFSDDPAVQAEVGAVALPCGAGFVAMSFFYCSRAVLAAQGRPGPVAAAFLVGAWGVGVPAAVTISRLRPDLGLVGIWYGFIAGMAVITLIASGAVLRSDWDEAARRAQARAHAAAVADSPAKAAEGGGEGDAAREHDVPLLAEG
jgi:Na+-driven multidrug efflux pump